VVAQVALLTGAAAPNDVLTLVASSPGAWGKRLGVLINTKNTKNKGPGAFFSLTVSEFENEQAVQTEKFLNLSINDSDPRYVPRVLKQSSSLIRGFKKNESDPDWIVPNTIPKGQEHAAESRFCVTNERR